MGMSDSSKGLRFGAGGRYRIDEFVGDLGFARGLGGGGLIGCLLF